MKMAKVVGTEIKQVGLPEQGILSNGSSVSNFNLLDEATLKSEGWVEFEDIPPAFDSETHELINQGNIVSDGKVIVDYSIEPRTPYLDADRVSVSPNGIDVATITYVNARSDAPVSVAFLINGVVANSPVIDCRASVQVASQTPGDLITISVEALEINLEVTNV